MTPTKDTPIHAPWRRVAALVGLGVFFVLYRPGGEATLVNGLALPALGVLCAWYLTRSVIAIGFAVALVAGLRADLAAGSAILSRVYPAVAVLAGAAAVVAAGVRFTRYARATRAERRARRRTERPD